MIRELISTSALRCLNGNTGFGIVAQTSGLAQNVSLVVDALSGYAHVAPPGNPQNPVVYLHALRRTGGMTRFIVSRIADCGNDYSGRTNRIAHHWIIEEGDIRSLPGGPGVLIAQNIFRAHWNEKPAELTPKQLSAPNVSPGKCIAWERLTGDAGWGGIVAEHAEKGAPISIVFPPGYNSEDLRTLISEALALLPPPIRWRITFSTYYMRSQETSGDKILIKCFLATSEEALLAQQSPNTLVIDLRQRLGTASAGKYVELARHGQTQQPPKVQPPSIITVATPPASSQGQVYEITPMSVPGPLAPSGGLQVPGLPVPAKKPKKLDYTTGKHYANADESSESWLAKNWHYLAALILCVLVPLTAIGIPQGCKQIRHMAEMRALEREQQQQERYERLVQKKDTLEKDAASTEDQFRELAKEFRAMGDYRDAVELAKKSEEQADKIKTEREEQEKRERAKEEKQREQYEKLVEEMKTASTEYQFRDIAKEFRTMGDYKDATDKEKECDTQADRLEAERKFDDNMKNLPSFWEVLTEPLENSKFLYEHRERVRLEYEPFFDLGSIPIEIVNAENAVILNAWGKKFASIELTEKGLQFKWYPVPDGIQPDAVGRAETLRLLSKLRITIDGNPEREHVVVLWRHDNEPNSLLKRTIFRDSDTIIVDFSDGSQPDKTTWERFTSRQDFEKMQRVYIEHPETKDKLLLMEKQSPTEGGEAE